MNATIQYAKKGNGVAIHIAHVFPGGAIATLCDYWGEIGLRGSRVRPIDAAAATCKSCLRNAAAKEVTA